MSPQPSCEGSVLFADQSRPAGARPMLPLLVLLTSQELPDNRIRGLPNHSTAGTYRWTDLPYTYRETRRRTSTCEDSQHHSRSWPSRSPSSHLVGSGAAGRSCARASAGVTHPLKVTAPRTSRSGPGRSESGLAGPDHTGDESPVHRSPLPIQGCFGLACRNTLAGIRKVSVRADTVTIASLL